jgi:hypothetical protein
MKATEETKAIARKLNIKHHPNISDATLQDRINAQPVAHQRDALKHVSQQKPPEQIKIHSAQEVRDAINEHFRKRGKESPLDKEGFQALFDEQTWTFRYRGREDSGHLSTSMRVILMKMEQVAAGAIKPKMMMFDGSLILAGK